MNQKTKKQSKEFDEYECGNGPRPPVPGEEASKMTTEGAFSSNSPSNSSSNANRSPDAETNISSRIERWQNHFTYLLDDKEGVDLLLRFVREEAGENSIDYTRLRFYFACEGLKQQQDKKKIRRLIRAISEDIIRDQIEVGVELRDAVSDIIQRKSVPDARVYDKLQKEVEQIIASSTYGSFLQSDLFIQFAEEHRRETDTASAASAQSQPSCSTNASTSSAGADGSSGFSGKIVELTPLIMYPPLQTLHEDTELNLSEKPTLTKTSTDRQAPKLTADLLLRTQDRRLKEIRPPGASAYTINSKSSFSSSYNPVSRQSSERQSVSSASLTDSDINSKDGKTYFCRKPTAAEDSRRAYMNPPSASQKTNIKPASQAARIAPITNEHMQKASKPLDPVLLCQKLNALIDKKQDKEFSRNLTDRLTKVMPHDDDDNQSILDQHVSRVFSPGISPGTKTPTNLNRHQHRTNEMCSSMPDFAMRHSKSIPEQASTLMFGTTSKKAPHRWPSQKVFTDSGIDSLYAAAAPYVPKPMTRKQVPLPPVPSYQSPLMPTPSSHYTHSLPRQAMQNSGDNYTPCMYSFGDEKIPFLLKLPGKRVTLKEFKEYLPKKGNFRYYFTTTCDDPDSPIIQEEVVNDTDVLPLFQGKIKATVRSD